MNKCGKYLWLVFSKESFEFKEHWKNLFKIKQYIGDDKYSKENEVYYNNHIFVLISLIKSINFDEALSFFRLYESYEDDYTVDEDKHMIIFKVHDDFKKSLMYFKKSQYSKMYNQQFIEKYFSKTKGYSIKYKTNKIITIDQCKKLTEQLSTEDIQKDLDFSAYSVLSKTDILREMINHIYDIELTKDDELDNQIKKEEEIFRYNDT